MSNRSAILCFELKLHARPREISLFLILETEQWVTDIVNPKINIKWKGNSFSCFLYFDILKFFLWLTLHVSFSINGLQVPWHGIFILFLPTLFMLTMTTISLALLIYFNSHWVWIFVFLMVLLKPVWHQTSWAAHLPGSPKLWIYSDSIRWRRWPSSLQLCMLSDFRAFEIASLFRCLCWENSKLLLIF